MDTACRGGEERRGLYDRAGWRFFEARLQL